MSRFVPHSLAGQMALLLGLALFVAQFANFALILNERQKLSLAQNQGPAITRFAGVAGDVSQAAPEFLGAIVTDASHRGARIQISPNSGIADAERDPDIEARLSLALSDAEVRPGAVRATNNARLLPGERVRDDVQYIRLAAQRVDGSWLVARMPTPRRDPLLTLRLAGATFLLYAIVLGATIWVAMRLARPLRDLTQAADQFGGRSQPEPVRAHGPSDLRRAIDAFNAMNVRVVALLDEKDRMLGAIGHDLRTPLASLRIRIESMEPDEEREAAIAKIAEMTAMLEDILMLARTGRNREAARPTDLVALVEAVAEDHRALGQALELSLPETCVWAVQSGLIKRALDNLVHNALTYGGSARIELECRAEAVEFRVIDHGPGIDAAEMSQVLQPFVRLEKSRNSETGGTGLGLPIAAGIAASHGGTISLSKTLPHGLTATLTLSRASQT